MENKTIPVKVAVRIRPLVPRETAEAYNVCLSSVSGGQQIVLRTKAKKNTSIMTMSSGKSHRKRKFTQRRYHFFGHYPGIGLGTPYQNI